MSFLSYLKDGISLGSIYAIIALGYTMVYGIAKMLNFAHGDVIMVGAYVILDCSYQRMECRRCPACCDFCDRLYGTWRCDRESSIPSSP